MTTQTKGNSTRKLDEIATQLVGMLKEAGYAPRPEDIALWVARSKDSSKGSTSNIARELTKRTLEIARNAGLDDKVAETMLRRTCAQIVKTVPEDWLKDSELVNAIGKHLAAEIQLLKEVKYKEKPLSRDMLEMVLYKTSVFEVQDFFDSVGKNPLRKNIARTVLLSALRDKEARPLSEKTESLFQKYEDAIKLAENPNRETSKRMREIESRLKASSQLKPNETFKLPTGTIGYVVLMQKLSSQDAIEKYLGGIEVALDYQERTEVNVPVNTIAYTVLMKRWKSGDEAIKAYTDAERIASDYQEKTGVNVPVNTIAYTVLMKRYTNGDTAIEAYNCGVKSAINPDESTSERMHGIEKRLKALGQLKPDKRFELPTHTIGTTVFMGRWNSGKEAIGKYLSGVEVALDYTERTEVNVPARSVGEAVLQGRWNGSEAINQYTSVYKEAVMQGYSRIAGAIACASLYIRGKKEDIVPVIAVRLFTRWGIEKPASLDAKVHEEGRTLEEIAMPIEPEVGVEELALDRVEYKRQAELVRHALATLPVEEQAIIERFLDSDEIQPTARERRVIKKLRKVIGIDEQ